jgi:hypothetical protein
MHPFGNLMNPHQESKSMKHALSFSSAKSPTLYVREGGEASEFILEGEQRLSFSGDVFCIGYKNSQNIWKPCSHGSVHVKQCPSCQQKDVARVYTVGDFSLYPHLHEQLSAEKYIIYLAQFGSDITKVGLTRRSRMMERWKEQGADFAIPILEFDGPDDAYPAEQLLHSLYDVVGSVRIEQKIKRLKFDSSKARERISSIANEIISNPSLSGFVCAEKLADLSSHYPKISNPEIVDFVGGSILGAKGQWLFFEGPSDLHYGINMSRQIGKFFSEQKVSILPSIQLL